MLLAVLWLAQSVLWWGTAYTCVVILLEPKPDPVPPTWGERFAVAPLSIIPCLLVNLACLVGFICLFRKMSISRRRTVVLALVFAVISFGPILVFIGCVIASPIW